MEFVLELMMIEASEAIEQELEQAPDIVLDQDEHQVSPEDEEAATAKALKAPYLLSQQEIDDHEITHIPFRAWCDCCVRGRGKNLEHAKIYADLEHLLNTLSMDYYFAGQDGDETLSQLCLRCHNSKWTRCFVVPRKGPHPWVITTLVDAIKQMGYKRFVFKSDNEPALLR